MEGRTLHTTLSFFDILVRFAELFPNSSLFFYIRDGSLGEGGREIKERDLLGNIDDIKTRYQLKLVFFKSKEKVLKREVSITILPRAGPCQKVLPTPTTRVICMHVCNFLIALLNT